MAYSQRDPAWANILLGFNSSAAYTIGTAGCYVTAIANVCKWAGNDLNPQQINDICKQNNWFVNGGLLTRDDIPALLCSNLGYVGRTNWTGPTDINFFNDASDPNVAYIIEIDASKAPGIQTHFTMVWSKPDANDLEIDDSWDGVRKALSHYGVPSVIILCAMKFIKVAPPIPQPDPTPPPVPVVPDPPPYIPPAPPIIAAPAEKYTLLTILKYYGSLGDAQSDHNAIGTIDKGSYYVFATEGIYKNISTSNMDDQNKWVNTLDNKTVISVVTPVTQSSPPALLPSEVRIGTTNDTKWMSTYRSFHMDRSSDLYEVKQDLTMFDYSGKRKPVPVPKGQQVNMVGTFYKDGVMFYRTRSIRDEFFSWYYGIPLFDDFGTVNLVKVIETDPAKLEHRLGDYIHYWKDDFKQIGTLIWDVLKGKKR